MKKLLAIVLALICVLGFLPKSARADDLYLIPDSNTRLLTKEELHQWDRESLTYIFNEIFARYGYVFKAGGRYDNWFSMMPWYSPNANRDNSKAVMPKVTDLEWKNYHLIKEVIDEKDALGEKSHDPEKKCYRKLTPPGQWSLTGFKYIQIKAGQRLPVYSAPSTGAWRGANEKALVSTDGAVWAAGWENGWLLIYYETNNGSIRVGYVNSADMTNSPKMDTELQFAHADAVLLEDCAMTDDPLRTASAMTSLKAGETVAYLTSVINQNGAAWDYVETTIQGRTARGYIPAGSIGVVFDEEDDFAAYNQ